MIKISERQSLWLLIFNCAVVFFLVCGPQILNPSNDVWLLNGGDLTQQYFGWAFFRNSPWTFPLGLNPMYGMDISSSIVYSDGNPLVSLMLKPFSAILTDTFQFQGIWLLICFLMQGFFAWKILGLYTNDSLSRTLGATLFILTPPFLFRVGVHTNLAAQFLILAALYLNLKPSKKNHFLGWIFLLVISLGIHFYIFAMVFSLWIADLLDKSFSRNDLSRDKLLKRIFITASLITFFAWQFGYFATQSPSLFGYGFFKANLLSLFNPYGWSLFIQDLPIKSSWGEGNLYLGLGVICLAILAFIKSKFWGGTNGLLGEKRFLFITLTALALFSITNQIGVGKIEFQIPLPASLLQFFGILRHSARLFWPVYYAILIVAAAFVCKNFSLNTTRIILFSCLLLQAVDLYPGLKKLHQELNQTHQNQLTISPLQDKFWEYAANKYQNVYLLPSKSEPNPDFMSRFASSDWKVFGRWAQQNKLNTNAVYLSRYDTKKQSDSFSKSQEIVKYSLYDENTLYIIKNEDLVPVLSALRGKNYLFSSVDGFNVLAPNFYKFNSKPHLGNWQNFDINTMRPNAGEIISFSRPGSSLIPYTLTRGWNNREDWGVWSKGNESVLTIPTPNVPIKSITLNLRAFVNGAIPRQIIQVDLNNNFVGEYSLDRFEGNLINIPLTSSEINAGYITLSFKIPMAASPASIGMDNDDRTLGIGIVSFRFNKS